MKADMLGMPVTALETVDAGTVGSAMLTGIAVGCFKDLDDAADRMVRKVRTYRPKKEVNDTYMAAYKRYAKVYRSVRGLM